MLFFMKILFLTKSLTSSFADSPPFLVPDSTFYYDSNIVTTPLAEYSKFVFDSTNNLSTPIFSPSVYDSIPVPSTIQHSSGDTVHDIVVPGLPNPTIRNVSPFEIKFNLCG